MKGDLKDAVGDTAWSFSKSMFSMGASLKVTKGSGDLDAVDAIWSTVILNEIVEAENDKDDN